MKRFYLVLLVLCLSLVFISCDRGGSTQTQELRFIVNVVTDMPQAVDYFRELHPEIDVDMEMIPVANIFARYQALLAVNDLPDVMWAQSGTFLSMARAGIYADLSQALNGMNYEGDMVWRNTFVPELLAASRALLNPLGPEVYSRDWGVPTQMTSIAILYDKAFFDANGLREPTNWNEFVDLNNRLVAMGRVPMSTNFANIDWFPRLFWDQRLRPELTANPFAFEEGDLTFTHPQVIQGLEDFKNLYDAGWFPSNFLTATPEQLIQAFLQGGIVQLFTVPGLMRFIYDVAPPEWSLASYVFPSITGLPPRSLGGPGGIQTISGSSDNFDTGLILLKFLTSRTYFSQHHTRLLNSGLVNVPFDPDYTQVLSGFLQAAANGFIPDIYVPINASPELIDSWRSDLFPNWLQGRHTTMHVATQLQRLYEETYLVLMD